MTDYTGLLDMFDGGGAGRSGQRFEGGPLSGLLNSIGVRPQGFQERMGQVKPQARPQQAQTAPQQPAQAQSQPMRPQARPMPSPSPMAMRGPSQQALSPMDMRGPSPMNYGQQPQQQSGPQMMSPDLKGLGLSPEEMQALDAYIRAKGGR